MRKWWLKALSFAAAFVFFVALLPLGALAVEDEGPPADSGGPGDSFYEDTAADEDPADDLPESGTPEGGGEAGDPAEDPMESGTPEDGGEAGDPAEDPPESGTPGDGEEAGDPAEGLSEPGTPEDGEEAAVPPDDLESNEAPSAEPEEVPAALLTADTRGRITLDGSLDDWAKVPEMDHSDEKIDYWKAARDREGNVYLCFTGTAVTSYDESYYYKYLNINQDGNSQSASFGELSGTFAGAEVVAVNKANRSTPAPYYLEAMIPKDRVQGEGCTLTVGLDGYGVLVAGLPVLDGEELPREEPVYNGIRIDGDFSDWEAVSKTPIVDPSPQNNNLESVAFLFDGDLYVYIKETPGGDAATAGSHSTGNYVITTDLGRMLKFQLVDRGGSVYGVAGAEARHVGREWEIMIPAEALPYYNKTVSFGLYLEAPVITDVSDLKGGGGNADSFTGIEIDGSYGDWAAYPHSVIQYATPGTQAPQTDSQGALYMEDGILYGHVMTTMPEHLEAKGGDFLAAISIAFNGERDYKEYFWEGNFYPRMLLPDNTTVTVNESTRLEPGIHTFEICDRRDTDPNLERFGTMLVTIDPYGVCHEMEFQLDLKKVTERQGGSVSDLRTVEAQFGRLGQEWITFSGASSGAFLGVALCCGVTAGVLLKRRKRGAVQ